MKDFLDEDFNLKLNDIITFFENLPLRKKKSLLLEVFDRMCAMRLLLQKNEFLEEEIKKIYEEKYDEIKHLREGELEAFLIKIMKSEF